MSELAFIAFNMYSGTPYFLNVLSHGYSAVLPNIQGLATYIFDRELSDEYSLRYPQAYKLG